jgi:hypothetical protein
MGRGLVSSFVLRKMKNMIIFTFRVKNFVCHTPPPLFAEICATPSAKAIRAKEMKFWLPESFWLT